MVTKRTYNQYCGVANALDILGERWTLLIVRNLLLGPQRYKDLLDGLPGIGTNLLADRLKDLERADVIQRSSLAPPAGSSVYELTARGWELEPIVFALGNWGFETLKRPTRSTEWRARWTVLGMLARLTAESTVGIRESYEIRVGDEVYHAVLNDGEVSKGQGPAAKPDVVMTSDAKTFLDVASGRVPAGQALTSGRLKLEGAPSALGHFGQLFAQTTP